MNFKLIVSVILTIIINISYTANAQIYEIEKVKPRHFKGTYEIKDFGYAACYKESQDWVVEILDENLVKKNKAFLGFNISDETYVTGYSNGASFLLVFCHNEKSNDLISFDYTGKILDRVSYDKKIGKVLPCKDKGYYLLNNKKKDGQIEFLTNKLHSNWSTDVPHKLAVTDLFSKGEILAQHGFEIFYGDGLSSANENALVWNFRKTKGMMGKPVLNEVHAVSVDGEKLFSYKLDHETEHLLANIIHNNSVYLFIYNWPKNRKEKLSEDIVIRKFNLNGKLLEEKKAKNFFKDYNKMEIATYQMEDFIDAGELFIMSRGFRFSYFDKEMNFKYNRTIKKEEDAKHIAGPAARSSQLPMNGMITKSYSFISASRKGLYHLIVYFKKKKRKVNVEVATTKDQSVSKLLKEVENEQEKPNKLKVSWIDIFPSEPGVGVLSIYSPKSKTITFMKLILEK